MMGVLTIQGAPDGGGGASVITLCWQYFVHFGWWVSHNEDILTPQSRCIKCFLAIREGVTQPLASISMAGLLSPSKKRGENVRKVNFFLITFPFPSSLSLDGNKTSVKVRGEGYLDNAFADLRQHCGLFVLFEFVLRISLNPRF